MCGEKWEEVKTPATLLLTLLSELFWLVAFIRAMWVDEDDSKEDQKVLRQPELHRMGANKILSNILNVQSNT